MKYLTPLIALLFIVSCSSLEPLPGSKSFTSFDFSKYSEQGFLFTPEGYSDDYTSIGMVNVTFWPEVVRAGNTKSDLLYRYQTDLDGNRWYVEQLQVQAAIDSMHSKASDMGADAVIRFNSTFRTRQHGSITIVGIELDGFAIKREN